MCVYAPVHACVYVYVTVCESVCEKREQVNHDYAVFIPLLVNVNRYKLVLYLCTKHIDSVWIRDKDLLEYSGMINTYDKHIHLCSDVIHDVIMTVMTKITAVMVIVLQVQELNQEQEYELLALRSEVQTEKQTRCDLEFKLQETEQMLDEVKVNGDTVQRSLKAKVRWRWER